MCGIVGIVDLNRGGHPALDNIAAMADTLTHRGPDGRSCYHSPSGRCALGHTRLKVIDLETGDQPMPNEDGSVQVVFNGEIYNFRALRRELEGRGHRFSTRSDTEVLVHGYEEWGTELPGRLEGMFAFAVWSETTGELFLARDRAGQKPLFVYEKHGLVIFASEIKAILAAPDVDDTLDPAAVPLYLTYGYVPTPGSFYRSIRKIPPGTTLRVGRDGEVHQDRYWRLDFTPSAVSSSEAVQRVRELTHRAVERRLISDVPLGAFLSGGVDLTIVVALMSQMMEEPVRTFSIGFSDDPSYDETAFAEMASKRFGTDHTKFVVEAGAIDLVDELVHQHDEPFGDSSAIPTYIVSRLTGEHVTVALTGDAGDELFAGYHRFLGAKIAESIPAPLARLGDSIGRHLPYNQNFRSLSRRTARFFAAAALPAEERTLRWIGYFGDRLDELLRPDLRDLLSRAEITRSFREPLERNPDLSPLARALALNFETYLPDDLLVKADRCSMAHGLELRAPFLDRELMEYVAALPDRLKIRGRSLKHVLKEAFRDLLPAEIRSRAKMGFGVPLPIWFRTHWRPLVEDFLLADDARIRDWIEPSPVRSMAEAHFRQEADYGHQLWALLTLEKWLRRGRFSMPS